MSEEKEKEDLKELEEEGGKVIWIEFPGFTVSLRKPVRPPVELKKYCPICGRELQRLEYGTWQCPIHGIVEGVP